jgi:hypothetical protein
VEFRTERLALRFERYLKSGAGHAFARRHFEVERSLDTAESTDQSAAPPTDT